MPEVTTFMMFESSANLPRPDGKSGSIQQMSGPITAVRPIGIPGSYSFAICFGIIGIDFKQANTVQMKIFTPNGELLQDTGKTPLPQDVPEDTIPAEYVGFTMTADIRNLVILNEGRYQLSIILNDEEIFKHSIPIYTNAKVDHA